MSPAPLSGAASWWTSCCTCGCRRVRFHADAENGQPLLCVEFSAEQALDLARDLIQGAEHAAPGVLKQGAAACH